MKAAKLLLEVRESRVLFLRSFGRCGLRGLERIALHFQLHQPVMQRLALGAVF